MLDIKLIRENPKVVENSLKKRGDEEKVKLLKALIESDEKYREELQELEKLKHDRNVISEEIAKLKKEKKDASKKIKEAAELPENIKKLEEDVLKLKEEIDISLMKLPNILHESVPFGKNGEENVEIKKYGKPPKFDFEPKNHLDILKNLCLIDDERAEKVTGRGFFYLKGSLVLLDSALQRYALEFLMKKGYTIIEPPFMLRKKAFEGATDIETLKDQIYKIENEDAYLIGTAEHPLGSSKMDEIINKSDLPIKLCGVSPCFRKEVGAHGKYTKGLFRMHQFNKVEQFIFCLPEDSWKFLEEIEKNSEELYRGLGLHYRVVVLCTGDSGIMTAKTYDTEAWMTDGVYREVGSASNFTDYQARRLNIKYRDKNGQAPAGFVHTLNNTAIATSRTMVALIEQFQQKDGTVLIPKVLWPYMNGIKKLEKLK